MSHEPPVPPGNQSPFPIQEPPHPPAVPEVVPPIVAVAPPAPKPEARPDPAPRPPSKPAPIEARVRRLKPGRIVGAAAGAGAVAFGIAALLFPGKSAAKKPARRKGKSKS